MFSNKKKNFFKSKIFASCIAVLLLGFGIWLNYDGGSDKQANTVTKVDETTQNASKSSSVVDSRKGAQTESTTKDPEQQVYYLVREVEGVIKIFYCDKSGKESLYEITSIPFDLLGKEDQQLFIEGVRLETKQDVENFIENFDS